ncbi:MAG: glycosyltransferase [Thomasclavelia sp.]
MNDGSTDKTGELCEYYANLDKRIKVIHKKNEGVAYARNTGIDFATGKYIGFVDSDDFVELDMYEILYSAMISNDADISQCSYNRVEGKKIIPINKTQNNIILNNEDGMKNVIDATIFFPAVWNKLYKRNIIKTYFRSFRLCEDRIFNIETFINAKKSIYVDICKYNYVNNVSSLVNKIIVKKI